MYVCVICALRTAECGSLFVELPGLFRAPCIIFRASKNNLGREFENFKSCDIPGKSHFILGTEFWGSRYEELLRLVKFYIIDIIYGNCANQSCMALALVRCSIEVDEGGTLYARARVSLVSWEG